MVTEVYEKQTQREYERRHMSDREAFPEELLEGDYLSICKATDCNIPHHRIDTRKDKHGVSRLDSMWLQDAVMDMSENNKRLVAYKSDSMTPYMVNIVADIGHKEPVNFTFELEAENLQVAHSKAMSFWYNACHHMDTGAHMRMGLYTAMHLHDNSLEKSDIHYGIDYPTLKTNEPLLITISNASKVGVMHSDGLSASQEHSETIGEELMKEFYKLMDKETEEE